MTEKVKFKRDSKIIFREEDDVGLLFNPDTGRVNILNETGKFIWSRLAEGKTKARLAEEVKDEFDILDLKHAERTSLLLYRPSAGRESLRITRDTEISRIGLFRHHLEVQPQLQTLHEPQLAAGGSRHDYG